MEPIEVLLEDRMYIIEVAVSLPGLLTEPTGLIAVGGLGAAPNYSGARPFR